MLARNTTNPSLLAFDFDENGAETTTQNNGLLAFFGSENQQLFILMFLLLIRKSAITLFLGLQYCTLLTVYRSKPVGNDGLALMNRVTWMLNWYVRRCSFVSCFGKCILH
ncbi:uncharacterized protein LOC130801923 [Amaranthus tricolor]|uniref:uncharacterized protein LOC130801923 n=1 Tax=Amaranthus tricolor TaxID=29722 RepID=UPI00258A13D3|nr:uncharacterized protein LOC130801923 [Amaranthus tricolor]